MGSRGFYVVLGRWHRNKSQYWNSSCSDAVPSWTYDAVQDVDRLPPVCEWNSNATLPRRQYFEIDANNAVMEPGEGSIEATSVFSWPSEASRYLAMSPKAPTKTAGGEGPHEGKVLSLNLSLSAKIMRPCHTSSLRVLVSKMQAMHQEVFCDDVVTSDGKFWETFFISLDERWGCPDLRSLKARFGWLLEYIRIGELPSDALHARNILRHALADTVLTNSKHPYDYDTVCLTNRHLNPDLSQEWVIGFLTANDAVPTIEASIREHMDGFAIKGFCYSFGILIADI